MFPGDKVDHQLVLIVSLIVSIIMMFGFPMIHNINYMYGFIMIAGISNGCIDTIGNCWIIHLWGKENPPFMQVIHFMFGLGCFLTPFIVEPFLFIKETDDYTTTSLLDNYNSTSTYTIRELIGTTTEASLLDNSTSIDPIHQFNWTAEDILIQWPFIIISIYNLFMLVLLIFTYFFYPDNAIHPSRVRKDNEIDTNGKIDKFKLNTPLSGFLKMFVVTVATLSMHAYVGKVQLSYNSIEMIYSMINNY